MRPLVLFDADCGFCTRAAGAMTGPWIRADVEAVALQRVDLEAYGLDRARCLEVLHVVDGHAVFLGSDAVARVLRAGLLPWRVVGIALTLPGIRSLASWTYALVARNRQRLPGGTDSCDLPRSAAVEQGFDPGRRVEENRVEGGEGGAHRGA